MKKVENWLVANRFTINLESQYRCNTKLNFFNPLGFKTRIAFLYYDLSKDPQNDYCAST